MYYHPYPFEDEADKNTFLGHPGSSNVTAKFNHLILFGLVANCIYVVYQVFQIIISEKTKEKYSISLMGLSIVINIMWLTQFTLLLVFRYSHAGRVCSGDFETYIPKDDQVKYTKYYLHGEGNFF